MQAMSAVATVSYGWRKRNTTMTEKCSEENENV